MSGRRSAPEQQRKKRAGVAAQQALRRALGDEGRHFTRQRAAVFDYLSRVQHHPTAEDVFLAVKRELPKISLATVYKNLEALVACGAAAKLTCGDAAARYEARRDRHYHTRCLKCGSIADLEPDADAQLSALLKPSGGFRVTDYRIEVLGHCRECRTDGLKKQRKKQEK